jgi:C_GCAxxG_C_C family probable redox protein
MGADYETAVKVAAGFAGGMYLGSVCGALTGGIMALGLKHGGLEREARARTSHLVRELAERFKAKHGSVLCPDLIHCDLPDPWTDPEAMNKARDEDVFAPCPEIVRDAATILEELLNEPCA